jgi:hypothetical protein
MTQVSYLQPLPDPTNSTYALVKEKIMTDLSGISILTNSFLHKVYLDELMHLVESGIIENIMSCLKPQDEPTDDVPVALSLNNSLIWFKLWAGFMIIAVLLFFLEILIAKMGKKDEESGVRS